MSYIRPEGLAADLQFSGVEYARPQGNEASFGQGAVQFVITVGVGLGEVGAPLLRKQYERIDAVGADHLAAGWPAVRDPTRYARPYGLAAHFTTTGLPYTRPNGLSADFGPRSLTPTICPAGIDSGAVGQVVIKLGSSIIRCGGIPPSLAFGTTKIWLYSRYIGAVGHWAQSFGNAHVAWERQYVLPVQIYPRNGYGAPWVSRSPRSVAPVSIFTEFYTLPMVGYNRNAAPVGFDALAFGQTAVRDNSQTIYPLGWTGDVPWPTVFNWTQYVAPDGFKTHPNDTRWGWPKLYNLRQYIGHYHDIPEIEWQGEIFGKWLSIENWIRHVTTTGVPLTRYGYPYIYNNARLVAPTGIESIEPPEFYKAGEVSHYRRYILPDGMEAPYISRWTLTYNAARPILPLGEVHTLFGDLLTEDRSVRAKGFDTHFVSGQAFIAPRIRGVEQRWPSGAPTIPLPTVMLWTRYIEPAGIAPKQVGNAALSIHRNDIGAFGSPSASYGQPTVWNVTPELRTMGYNHAEFGDLSIRTQWRNVYATGYEAFYVGKPKIADRRQWIEFVTIPTPLFGNTVVTRIGAEPPSERKITPLSFPDINWLTHYQVPAPIAGAQSVYPEGVNTALYGNTRITSNVLRVEPGVPYPYPLNGPFVSLKNRVVTIPKDDGIDATMTCGKPRITPWTIYPCVEAPQQAKDNHFVSWLHYVGHDRISNQPLYGVGNPTIALQHRWIAQRDENHDGVWMNDQSRFGRCEASNFIRYLAPPSFRPFRCGAHTVIGGVQEPSTLDGIPPPDPSFGGAIVAHKVALGPRHIYPSGFVGVFGTTEAQLKNRTIKAAGTYSERMGYSRVEGPRYMRQSLHVGFPDNPPMQGWDSSLFGTAWISLRIRGIEVDGFCTEDFDYDVLAFDQRMRIRNATTNYQRPTLSMLAEGANCSDYGISIVENSRQYIRPDGNSETYRQGVY